MEEREQKSHGSGCAIVCLAALVFLPMLYVLSLGPAALYVNGNPDAERVATLIYYPLLVAGEYCRPIEDALDWYIELWTG